MRVAFCAATAGFSLIPAPACAFWLNCCTRTVAPAAAVLLPEADRLSMAASRSLSLKAWSSTSPAIASSTVPLPARAIVSELVAKYASVAAAFAVPEGAPEAEARISITRSALSAVRAMEDALTTVLSPTRAPVSLWISVQATVPPTATLVLPAARPILAAISANWKSLSASTAKAPSV